MRCPSCNSLDTQVKDSRPTEDSAVIRRRRVCVTCNFRFTTFERVQLRELTVIKRNGRRVPFDRDKLVRSLQISLRKRPVDPERVEKMVSAIVRELESAMVRALPAVRGGTVEAEDLGLPGMPGRRAPRLLPEPPPTYKIQKRRVVEAFEQQYLRRLISEHRGNVSRAARAAGKERRDLGKLLKRHGLDPRRFTA